MADDFRIQISAELKSADLENIKSQINGLKTTPIKLNIDTKNVQSQISDIKKQIESLGNVRVNFNGNIGGAGGAGTTVSSIKKSVSDVAQAYNDLMKLQNRINSIRIKINGLDSAKSIGQIDELRGQLNRLMTDYNNLYQTFGKHFSTDQIDNLNHAFEVTSNKVAALNAGMKDNSAIKQQTEAYKQLYTVAKQMDSLELQIGKLKSVGGNDTQISTLKSQLESLRKEYQSLYSTLQGNLSSNQLAALGNSFYDLQNKLDVLNAKVIDTQTKLANGIQIKIDNGILENQISSIESRFKSLNTENEKVSVGIQKLKDLLKNMNGNSDIKSVVKDYESFKQTLTSVTNQVSEMQKVSKQTATAQQTLTSSQTLSNNIQTWMNNNTKATQQFGVQLKDLQNKLNNNTNPAVLKNCSAEFKKIQSEAKAAGTTVSSFANSLKSAVLSAVGLSSLTTAFYTGIRYIKQSVSTIVELDNALVDLQKTATATKTQLNDFYFDSNDVAKKYGASTQEIIQSAADWSRSGYSLDDSKLMAQYSSMFKSISPGMNIDTATTSLVSIMKAYGIEAENVLDDVMSKINKVGKIIALDNYIG